MTILDNHAWIWWVNESPQLSPAAQGAIETANDLGVHL
jgi:PIN domain nuclease of toxin-antitoxin system